jgi:6-phosphogluconolactonase
MGGRDVGRVEVFPDAGALAAAAAEHVVRAAADATRQAGRFVVALSGGSTPKSLYAMLASERYAPRVDWSRVHVCWSDERCVPPDDPASNYRVAREALLDVVPLSEENVHRIRGEDEPGAAAAAYERDLRRLFGTPDGLPRMALGARFDLVLLGMGIDGHTASLFPGLTAVRESRRWAVAEQVAALPAWRVTLTPPVIDAAAEVAFLVSGRDKAAMLRRVLEGSYLPDELPAQAVAPRQGRLRWLLDADAAADLRRSG